LNLNCIVSIILKPPVWLINRLYLGYYNENTIDCDSNRTLLFIMSHYEEKYHRAAGTGVEVTKPKRNPWKWATFILAMALLALVGYETHRCYHLHNQNRPSRIIRNNQPGARPNHAISTPKRQGAPSPIIVESPTK
jgi:hypothetical protein